MTEGKEGCQWCHFWISETGSTKREGRRNDRLMCVRHAPVIPEKFGTARWPITYGYQRCGEFLLEEDE